MPYAVRKRGNQWVTINKETGDVKGTHSSREKALAQMRLLYHVESGGRLTKTKNRKPRRRR